MEETINNLIGLGITYGIRFISAVAIYIVGRWIAGILSQLLEKGLIKSKVDNMLSKFARNIVYGLMLVFVILAVLNKLGVNTTSAVAVIGAAGLAVGLALQGSLANFAAGAMIIFFKPFKLGDFIEAGGTMGTVEEIQIFNTILITPDGRKVIVANNMVTNSNITNFTGIKQRRVDLVFGISYNDDMKKAKEILLNLVNTDQRILKDPAPVVAVSELGDNSVNLVCRPWVKPADYWGVYFDLTEKGKEELEKNGLSIPYPQREVHVIKEAQEALQST